MSRYLTLTLLLTLFLVACNSNSSPTQETLETLPDGDYLFVSDQLIEGMQGNYQRIALRKSGNTVVGINIQYLDSNPCFKGQPNQNSIVDVTKGLQFPLGESNQKFSQADAISLTDYKKVSQPIDTQAIEECIAAFNKMSQ